MPHTGCQVHGCEETLPETSYHRRYKICQAHFNVEEMILEGIPVRFCQQCAKFESLVNFDKGRKTCRAKLLKHNAQRRRKRLCDKGTLLEKKNKSPKKKSKSPPPPSPVKLKLRLPPVALSKPRMGHSSETAPPLQSKSHTENQGIVQTDSVIKNNNHVPSISELKESKEEFLQPGHVSPPEDPRQSNQQTSSHVCYNDSAFIIGKAASSGVDIYNIANFDIPNFDWQAGLPHPQHPLCGSLPAPLIPYSSSLVPLVNLQRAPSWSNIDVVGEALEELEKPGSGPFSSSSDTLLPAGPSQRLQGPLLCWPKWENAQQQQLSLTDDQFPVVSPPETLNTRLVMASYQLFRVPPNLLPWLVRLDLEEYLAEMRWKNPS